MKRYNLYGDDYKAGAARDATLDYDVLRGLKRCSVGRRRYRVIQDREGRYLRYYK